ncbi:MAG: hypothetical protein FJX77_10455 [Armatimonadetes bacterium]|nr:hypothetical protein [Armatimonadota bacterium]
MPATQGQPDPVRLAAKLQLLPALLQAGFAEEEGQYPVELLDWLIVLPAPWEAELDRAWARLEEDQAMALTLPPSRLERRLSARGREEGRVEAERRTQAELLAWIPEDLAGGVVAAAQPARPWACGDRHSVTLYL